jgi:glycosyltransferase involved in cell wall biosynthesis
VTSSELEGSLKLALYHGYELSGSGSNEYTRYLASTWAQQGHTVSVICAEPDPSQFDFVDCAYHYGRNGARTLIVAPKTRPARVTVHCLPTADVYPVYLTDKQRQGVVKSFSDLSDDELANYHAVMSGALRAILQENAIDVLHCNHVIYQPIVAMELCDELGIPFYIVPHGSSIEYVVKHSPRYQVLAHKALKACSGVVWIAPEVRQRTFNLFPELKEELCKKEAMVGIGTDTSVFQPIPREQRQESLSKLKTMLRSGGKSFKQTREFQEKLSRGDVSVTRAYWNSYNHNLEDEDLGVRLSQINTDDNWMLFLGALTYGKGIHSLLTAMPAILKKQPNTQLFIVGSGTYREFLEALVYCLIHEQKLLFQTLVRRGQSFDRNLGNGPLEDVVNFISTKKNRKQLFEYGPLLKDRVHFCGRLDHSRLKHLFPCCDIAVFPSLIKEASPLVMAESLANGVLPSGANHSGLKDGLDGLSKNLEAGLIRKMRLPAEMEKRIPGFIRNIPALLDRAGNPTLKADLRALAVEKYDWRTMAEQLALSAQRFSRAP